MANDPHRDLLPVRDCSRNGKGFTDKFDYQILGKLSRCELEDRFLRLLDEQTHIKKLANSQEEKIKRLGTKLLRLINEKKSGKKFTEHSKETEDLHLRIIELEHENYRLKDKNTVLKQQLSTHTRHIRTHRSPVRSTHTSPEMTTRQSAPAAQSESPSDIGNKNGGSDLQLQEAKTHIKELNKQIECLHGKIRFLEQNLEKYTLDNRKIKVTENIELIRLQRSLKQQQIQIASLQEQVKNSEKTQKLLKEELVKAHKENDEALHLISVKQGEILNLCSKLEEKNLNKLEEDELNERIRDLVLERDCLKERSDFLMKTIIAKAEEWGEIKELQKLLEEEKCKKEKLEETLENLKSNTKIYSSEIFETVDYEKSEVVCRCQDQQTSPEKKEIENCIGKTSESSESPRSFGTTYKCPSDSSDTESLRSLRGNIKLKRRCTKGKSEIEKMKLELELQYLREMLRSQTLRCEAQQGEITRLMYELKLNENKCSETLQRLDWHLRIFESLEMRAIQNEIGVGKEPVQPEKPGKLEDAEKPEKCYIVKKEEIKESKEKLDIESPVYRGPRPSRSSPPEKVMSPSYSESSWRSNYEKRNLQNPIDFTKSESLEEVPSKLVSKEKTTFREGEPLRDTGAADFQSRRFVDQIFLESSDEELNHVTSSYQRESLKKKYEGQEFDQLQSRNYKAESNGSIPSVNNRNSIGPSPRIVEGKKKGVNMTEDFGSIKIGILWFKITPGSSLWKNDAVEMLFIDFSFLDINGEETETPESVAKPRHFDEKCEFNFTQTIILNEITFRKLLKLIDYPDSVLIILKVVSDSEKYDETNEECEDVGGAEITSRQFLEHCNKGPFQVPVKNSQKASETIGSLALSIEVPVKVLNSLVGVA